MSSGGVINNNGNLAGGTSGADFAALSQALANAGFANSGTKTAFGAGAVANSIAQANAQATASANAGQVKTHSGLLVGLLESLLGSGPLVTVSNSEILDDL